MTINVKLSLCKITKASKLFQRNYYLPLLKPLSPKDALRRKIITGQNVLGARIEHYIPTLEPYEDRMTRRKKRVKGKPVIKKRVRMNPDRYRYVSPFFDDDMEFHSQLKGVLARKRKGKGQQYVYEVTDKNCMLVLPFQMERAIRDKEIIDVVMAQRSEKIVVKLNSGRRITVPVAPFEGNGPLYRGSGWTKETVEEEHHHGKETFSLAKIFEAKEQGVEEWELEMMRMANKRKKKLKGEDNPDWKEMLQGCLDGMDWDKFEDDTKQILEEKDEIVEEEDIPMEVDDMSKTKNVAEKLKRGGEAVLNQLPTMKQVPEIIKLLDTGKMCEMEDVSGASVTLKDGKQYFVVGQTVKGDESEVFMPGQTLVSEDGVSEYTPGITVNMENEPTLIPGLVMGEEETPAMFLPGDSTITEGGQLQFEATEEDLPPRPRSPTPESSSSSSSEATPPPTPKPKRKIQQPMVRQMTMEEEEPPKKKKEKVKKRPPKDMFVKEKTPPKTVFRPCRELVEDPRKILEERRQKEDEEHRKRMKEKLSEKQRQEETKVDKLRMKIRQQFRNMKLEFPPAYEPIEPVKKSKTLEELESSIHQGTFLEDEKTKQIMENVRSLSRKSRLRNSSINYSAFGVNTKSFGFSRTYRVSVL